jgi:hypothetical protein
VIVKHLLGIVVFGLLFAVGTGAAITTVRSSKLQPPPPAVGTIPDDMKHEESAPLFETRLVDEGIPDEQSR